MLFPGPLHRSPLLVPEHGGSWCSSAASTEMRTGRSGSSCVFFPFFYKILISSKGKTFRWTSRGAFSCFSPIFSPLGLLTAVHTFLNTGEKGSGQERSLDWAGATCSEAGKKEENKVLLFGLFA